MADPMLSEPERDDGDTASAPEAGPWVFDETVAGRFDDMLERSIPGLADMREIVTDLSERVLDRCGAFTEPDEDAEDVEYVEVVDLGCSTGTTIHDIADQTPEEAPVRFVAVDTSVDMLDRARVRIMDGYNGKLPGDNRRFAFAHRDAGTAIADDPVDDRVLVLSILTLQFIDPAERHGLLDAIYASLAPGGAFIVVEKIDHRNSDTGAYLAESYRDFKRRSYTGAAIDRKDRALEGVLNPSHADAFERMLWRRFDSVETFWANRLFRGWIATKRGLGS